MEGVLVMDDFYMFFVGGIGVLLICAYILLHSMLGFRSKTTNRFMRVLILGIVAYFINGSFSTFLWIITYLYGFYAVIVSVIAFVYGKVGKTVDNIGIDGKGILNFVIGFVVSDRIIAYFFKGK